MSDTTKGFDTAGCFTTCHAGENANVKPYDNKYTTSAGEMDDSWHWKSARNLNQIDDQYLGNTQLSTGTHEAGRKSDAKEGGGYVNNETEDKKLPAFMATEGGEKDGLPGSVIDSDKVPFDDTLFKAGDRVPAIVKSEMVGDRGDIPAVWKWADGARNLEFCRALDTGSPTDVNFTDMAKAYYFGVTAFDNAQVRHAFQAGATPFVFQP